MFKRVIDYKPVFLWHHTLAPTYKPTSSQPITNVLDIAVMQVIKLHAAFMQLVQTVAILAQNVF
jgi:hypothetical protein